MATYTIRQLSQRFHLPPSTLRYYEDEGILTGVARDAAGQRVYEEKHVHRLGTICCFKGTGMTIAQLKVFFACEQDEPAHIEEILALLDGQQAHVEAQLAELARDHAHIRRKRRYYGDIKAALDAGLPLPKWEEYRDKVF